MRTIKIGVDYKEQQRINTEAEIKRMEGSGAQRVSIEDIDVLLGEIGLKLDLNPNSYLMCYYNTSNENHYYEATTSPIDKKKISAYNSNSEWYQKHFNGGNDILGNRLQKLRLDYFCTYRKRGIDYILSF